MNEIISFCVQLLSENLLWHTLYSLCYLLWHFSSSTSYHSLKSILCLAYNDSNLSFEQKIVIYIYTVLEVIVRFAGYHFLKSYSALRNKILLLCSIHVEENLLYLFVIYVKCKQHNFRNSNYVFFSLPF